MRHLIAALVVMLPACGSVGYPIDNNPPADNPLPPGPAPEPLPDGTYQLTTKLNLTRAQGIPKPAADLEQVLRDFAERPGATLHAVAHDANDPAVADLEAALTTDQLGQLDGWLDAELAPVTVGGTALSQRATDLAAMIRPAFVHATLASELTYVDGKPHHRLTSVSLRPTIETPLELVAGPGVILEQSPRSISYQGSVTFEAHAFNVPTGPALRRLFDTTCQAQLGGGLRQAVGAAVDCARVAHAVAAQCTATGCVGHEDALRAACEGGLDALVARVDGDLDGMQVDTLLLRFGSARLIDGDRDGRADALAGGGWDATMDFGFDRFTTSATFTGVR